jgi:hypothetical protein
MAARNRSDLYHEDVTKLSDTKLYDSTFCKEDLERPRSSWASTQPTCVFCGKKYRGNDAYTVRCHIDKDLKRESTGRNRTVGPCTPDAEHKARHQEVLQQLRAKARDVKKKLVDDARDEKRMKLAAAGEGTADDPMDLDQPLKKPAHLWIKSFLQGILDDNGEPLFDNLAWFALKVVSVVPSASACEHSWAIEGWIHSKRRNRLGQNLVEMLVRGHTNMVLKDALDMVQDLLPWDIELVIDEPSEHTQE